MLQNGFGLVKQSFVDFFAFNILQLPEDTGTYLCVNHSRGIRKHFFTEHVVASWTVYLLILTLVP